MSENGADLAIYHKARELNWPRVTKALDVLDSAFRLYGSSRVVVAFNGGKDATVVLHLARASLAYHMKATLSDTSPVSAGSCEDGDVPPPPPPHLTCLYLPSGTKTEFPEVTGFVSRTAEELNLDLHTVYDGGFAGAIEKFGHGRDMLAFVMGTRRSDPGTEDLEHFSPSTPGYPPFMRVNPILNWGYDDVWKFIRALKLPYCVLYDEGYTSIGSVEDTRPNPALRNEDATFAPPWKLGDASLERAGRESFKHTVKQRYKHYTPPRLFYFPLLREPRSCSAHGVRITVAFGRSTCSIRGFRFRLFQFIPAALSAAQWLHYSQSTLKERYTAVFSDPLHEVVLTDIGCSQYAHAPISVPKLCRVPASAFSHSTRHVR